VNGSALINPTNTQLKESSLNLIVAGAPKVGNGGEEFGCAVALVGDRLVVGAMADGEGGYNAGAAYIFEKAGAVWSQQAKLNVGPAQAGDLFGSPSPGWGHRGRGSPFDDDVGIDAGAAYVFVRTDSDWDSKQSCFPR